MEYYQEMVETEDGIPARIYYGGTGRDKLYYPLHWHRKLEFDLVMEGRIRGRVNGKEQSAGPGEIFFVNSGELHETDGEAPAHGASAPAQRNARRLRGCPRSEEHTSELQSH